MTDKWLAALNDDTDRLICHGPGRYFSIAQLRQLISGLQAAIADKEYQIWVLYDDDGFRFICAMFALLASGREVLIPGNGNKETIEGLLTPGTGLIGFHPDLQECFDIDVSPGKEIGDPGVNVCVSSKGRWGKVGFCTSGSSGQPKIITKSAEQLYLEVETFRHKWQPTANALFVPLVTHLHIYGLTFAFMLPVLARAGFYLPRNGGLLGAVEPITLKTAHSIDELVIVTSPTIGRQAEQIQVLAESGAVCGRDRPAPITKVFCAGGYLTNANAQKINKLFDCSVTEIFGSTETGAVATREHNKRHQSGDDNLWQLLPGLDAMVAGDNAKTGTGLKREFAVWGGHVGGSRENPVMTGDEVRFFDRHRFEFVGRSNQIYKIEGKRISLDYLVEILEGCELVTEAAVLPYEAKNKEVLLCGVVLSHQGESSYRSHGKFATDSSIKKHLLQFLSPVLVPRSIRYLDQMFRNEMGKIPQQALINLLVNPVFPELPLIANVKTTRNELVFSLRVPMELRFLRGHFETRPIVPGMVLLHWVYYFIDKYWKLPMNPAHIKHLKFSKPLTPGDRPILTIKRIGNKVDFLYESEHKVKFSSGQIPKHLGTHNV